jgi:hypothetical protein
MSLIEALPSQEAAFRQAEILPVSAFAHSYGDDPQSYPGQRPATSYLSDGQFVFPMRLEWRGDQPVFWTKSPSGGEQNVGDWLRQQDLPAPEDRYAVLGYGANLSPGALKSKFEVAGRPDLRIVPTIYTQVTGFDIVQSAAPGPRSNFFANLYAGEETADTETMLGVNLLTAEQLLMMNATESHYDLARSGELDLGGGHTISKLFYAGVSPILLRGCHPVALAAIPAVNRHLPTASSAELLAETLQLSAVAEALRKGVPNFSHQARVAPGDYVREALSRDDEQRTALQNVVSGALGSLGMRYSVDMLQRLRPEVQPRMQPSQLPTLGDMLAGRTRGQGPVRPAEEELSLSMGEKRDEVLRKLWAQSSALTAS